MPKQKSVIWFIVDQMRGQAIGATGDPNVFTPNLDNMAIAGTIFPNAVSGYPLCCPFRGSLLTGKYAHNHSVKLHEDRLDPSFRTVTDEFNTAGYDTLYLGKWHLGGIREGANGRSVLATIPRDDRGRFATWLGYDNNNSQWDCWLHGHEGDREIAHYRLPGYETDCLTDLAIETLSAHPAERPFFMVVSVQPPHNPRLAPPACRRYQAQHLGLRPNVPADLEADARFELSGYYAQIENIDANVGRLIERLRSIGRLDDTHILFFSDHGDQLGSQGRFGKCLPYAESVSIPLLIGGGIPMAYDGMQCGRAPCLVNHVDIAPTTLGLCGLATPAGMEGFDYSHRRTGVDVRNRMAQEPQSAYLQLIGDRESSYAWRCVVTQDGWKYACVKNGEWLMFNLNRDPYEQTNLAFDTRCRAQRERLKTLLRDWAEKTGDAFPIPGA